MLCLFGTEGYFSFVMWYWLFSVCFSLFWLYRRRTRTKTSVSVHSMTFLTCLRHGNSWERSSLARRWETLWPPHTNRLYALVFLYKSFFPYVFLSISYGCRVVFFLWVSVFCLESLNTLTTQTLSWATLFTEAQIKFYSFYFIYFMRKQKMSQHKASTWEMLRCFLTQICAYTVPSTNIGTLGKYEQRRLWK